MEYQDALDIIGRLSHDERVNVIQQETLVDVEDYLIGMHLMGKRFDLTTLHHFIDDAKSNKLGGTAIYVNEILDRLKSELKQFNKTKTDVPSS